MSSFTVLVLLLSSAFVQCTKVRECEGDDDSLRESEDVSLSYCEKLPCKLKKGTTANVEIKFSPEKDVEDATNSIYAYILGVPFPFIGVDGTSICEKVFDDETGEQAECPLQAGRKYVYRDEFHVRQVYPKLSLELYWALKDEDDTLSCFKVPVKIY